MRCCIWGVALVDKSIEYILTPSTTDTGVLRSKHWIAGSIHGSEGHEFSAWEAKRRIGRWLAEWSQWTIEDPTRSRRSPSTREPIGHLRHWPATVQTSPIPDREENTRLSTGAVRSEMFLCLSAPVTRSKLPVSPPVPFPLLDENPLANRSGPCGLRPRWQTLDLTVDSARLG